MKDKYLKITDTSKIILRYFLIIFLSLCLIWSAITFFLYHLEARAFLLQIKNREKSRIEVQKEIIEQNFISIASDLKFLSKQNEIFQFIETNNTIYKELTAKEYLEFCRQKAAYDQIRFIDNYGNEVIRVNYNAGNPDIVPGKMLQNKKSRYYFKESLALECNKIFISSFDLNIENNKIEMPLKPMIRFGMPLCDNDGKKHGVIALNYMGIRLLNLIQSANKEIMLTNSDGYWLHSPIPEDTWGFMLKERHNRRFSTDFPEAWITISSAPEKQFYNENGLFTFTTIYPSKKIMDSGLISDNPAIDTEEEIKCKDDYWKIISYISNDVLINKTRGTLFKFLILTTIVFVLTSIPAWFITKEIIRRRLHQLEMYELANFDRLTRLPNRAHFLKNLNQIHYQSQRYGHTYALLFIDLNGFKEINDTLGHDAGDQVLVEVGKRLSKCIRQSDMVARLGGDEFTIVLPFVPSPHDAQKTIEKILKEISIPLILNDSQREISASIGLSFYPDDGDSVDVLLKKADCEMYKIKRSTKKA